MIELSLDQEAVKSLGKALKSVSDGKALRRELIRNMRAALEPAKGDVHRALMAISSAGLGASPTLRLAVARQLKLEAKLSGGDAGARVRIKRNAGMPRGFSNAGKALAMPQGWRHPVHGNKEVFVTQVGDPNYFDRAIRKRRAEYRKAVLLAMEHTARRITRKV